MGDVPKSRESIQNWRTPPELFAWVNSLFGFTLDAAADGHNALCPRFFDGSCPEMDGLIQSWAAEVVWVNPPFKQIKAWLAKAIDACEREGATVVMLLPAATETRWFRSLVVRGQIGFLTPRVKYVHPAGLKKNGPPIGSMLVVFKPGILRAANDDVECTILEVPGRRRKAGA